MDQPFVDQIIQFHLKYCDHDRARLMYFVECPSVSPNNFRGCLSREFLDGKNFDLST